MTWLCYNDLTVGMRFETGGATLTEDAIIRFALDWDPQPFHIDKEAAKAHMLCGLTASGLHTWALSQRLCTQAGLLTDKAVIGLGLDSLRFVAPARPGDTLRVVVTVSKKRASRSRPELGIVEWEIETFNQSKELLLTLRVTNMVRRS